MRVLVLLLLCISLSFGKVYLLPKEAQEARDEIVKLIDKSKKSITIAMYNFSYAKFAKALVEAHKRGVNIKVILDSEKIKDKKSEYYFLKDNGIKIFVSKEKMHLKVAIFDDKKIFFGSANWKKASFSENYEILVIEKNKKYIKKVNSYLSEITK